MQTRKCSLALLLISALGAAHAQNYPNKPVHIHAPPPGGTADVVTRLVAGGLSPLLGQPVVVDNRPVGPILATSVSNAAPDGYTLLLWGNAFWVGPLLEPQPFDVFRDFEPISALTRSPSVFVVHPALPVKSVADLIKLAKSKPGALNWSSGSTGSSTHIAGELFKSMAGIDIVRITYKGGPQEMLDLMSGQIQMTFGGGTGLAPGIKSGKLRALATAGTGRSLLFPDLPTVAETLPGYVSEQVYALTAPRKTPEAIVTRLNQDVTRMLGTPDLREKLLANGLEPVGGPPQVLIDSMKAEMARVAKLIKDGAVKPGAQ